MTGVQTCALPIYPLAPRPPPTTSALLHDIGKIGIEDKILKKPGMLTPEEFAIMKQHPQKGAAIAGRVAQLREMVPGIELHHESLDGRGYPYGLRGKEIPLMACIIAVADTFDAMTTHQIGRASCRERV